MAPEKREWSVPAPLRALMWWPGVAFVLVMVVPEVAAVGIAASGVALVALGAAVPLASRRLRRTGGAPVVTPPTPPAPGVDDRPTVEMPTIQIPRVERAA